MTQLHWGGFENAIIVQQNGLSYTLSGPPVAGEDPTALVVIDELGELIAPLQSSVTPTRSIPVGTPWWLFDFDTDFCSRFAIIWHETLPSVMRTGGVATFTGTETGSLAHPWPTITWNNQFIDTNYLAMTGASVGSPDFTVFGIVNQTASGASVASYGTGFVGTVQAMAWRVGQNPFCDLHEQDAARLEIIVRRWKPARATCMGGLVGIAGQMWGWPVTTWGSWTWGGTDTVEVMGVIR